MHWCGSGPTLDANGNSYSSTAKCCCDEAPFPRTGTPGTLLLSLVAVPMLVTDARPRPGLMAAQGERSNINHGFAESQHRSQRNKHCHRAQQPPAHVHAPRNLRTCMQPGSLTCVCSWASIFLEEVSQQRAPIAHKLHLCGLAPVPHCRGCMGSRQSVPRCTQVHPMAEGFACCLPDARK